MHITPVQGAPYKQLTHPNRLYKRLSKGLSMLVFDKLTVSALESLVLVAVVAGNHLVWCDEGFACFASGETVWAV